MSAEGPTAWAELRRLLGIPTDSTGSSNVYFQLAGLTG